MTTELQTKIDSAFQALEEGMNPKATKELQALENKLENILADVRSFRKNPLGFRSKNGKPDFEPALAACVSSARFLKSQKLMESEEPEGEILVEEMGDSVNVKGVKVYWRKKTDDSIYVSLHGFSPIGDGILTSEVVKSKPNQKDAEGAIKEFLKDTSKRKKLAALLKMLDSE